MGDSGNAEGSVPHAHVEIRRPDGSPLDPYWSLRNAQRDVNCGIDTTDSVSGLDLPASSSEWTPIPLPGPWRPLALTGGHPGSAEVAARMWVSPLGFTPVDAAAVHAGDPRYDDPSACQQARDSGGTRPLAELAVILATIRSLESGGDYTAQSSSSTASGAYQFVESSWGGYGGYARAADAPPSVQDAKAAGWATAILDRNGGDVASVPVSWYIGHVPVGGEWDSVPAAPGNTLTPREYQRRWMGIYAELTGHPVATTMTDSAGWRPVDTSGSCHTTLVLAGSSDDPSFVLTQAQRFVVDAADRAEPAPRDPCDPAGPPAVEPTDEAIPARPRAGAM
jgi:hypothetical protein